MAKLALQSKSVNSASGTWTRIGLSLVQEEKGQLDDAYEGLSAIVKDQPLNLKAKHNLAELVFQMACRDGKKSKFQEAARLYRDLLKMAPYDVEAYIGLGLSLNELGDRQGSLTALKTAVSKSPFSAAAHSAYAKVLQPMVTRRREHAKLALKLDPGQKTAKSLVRHLTN